MSTFWTNSRHLLFINSANGAGTNSRMGGHNVSDAKRRKHFLSCPSTFLALRVHFGERFRDGQYILVSFLFAPRNPRAQPFVKVGHVAPVPCGSDATSEKVASDERKRHCNFDCSKSFRTRGNCNYANHSCSRDSE